MAATSDEWASLAKRYLLGELKRADVDFAELAKRLTEMSLAETEASVSAKISAGVYPGWWLFAVMRAIGAQTLRLE